MEFLETLKRKNLSLGSLFVNATMMLIFGLLLIFNFNFIEVVTLSIIFWGSLILASWGIIDTLISKQRKFLSYSSIPIIGYFLVASIIIIHPDFLVSILPIFLLITILLEGITNLVSWYLYRKDGIKHRFHLLVEGGISIIFLVVLIFYPNFRITITYIIFGIYFVVQAALLYYTLFTSLQPARAQQVKKKVRVALPVFFASLLPYKVLGEINDALGNKEESMEIIDRKSDLPVGVEVLVHMSEKGFARTGHIDIIYNDMVLSYGSYDYSTVQFNSAIGDGVIFVAPKAEYIPFVKVRSNKTLIGFGIYLSDKEKENLEVKIKETLANTIKWEPISQRDPSSDAHDYASDLYRATKACFYKVKEGKYKTYFVLNTNCVALADSLLGASGIDLISMSGIITPGSYLDYLEANYEINGTAIVTRTIYR